MLLYFAKKKIKKIISLQFFIFFLFNFLKWL